jgi:peroxiredoxin
MSCSVNSVSILYEVAPLAANYMPIVLQENAVLEITAQAAQFQATFEIKHPDAENRALLRLRDIRQKAWQQEQQGLRPESEADEHALLDHEAALLRFQQPMMAFADSSAYYWPALVAARWVSPSGDYERVPEFMFRQCEQWREKNSASGWTAQLCQAANREKLPVLIGDTIPDTPLPMLAGDTVLLHTLLGSRITVLDIWASWCAPCRRENRAVLNPIWTKYKNSELQIIGYSIDSSPNAWKAAIDKDGASWPHASHLSGDATPFMTALRITTIPANFILNAQGKVIAKNLHGEALRIFIEDYLK